MTLILAATTLFSFQATAKPPKLDGVWRVKTAELGGRNLGEAFAKNTVLTIDSLKYDVFDGNGHDKGDLKLFETEPKGMDILGKEGPNKGKTIPAIYKLKGDDLTICYNLAGERPKEFLSKPKSMLLLISYQRQK